VSTIVSVLLGKTIRALDRPCPPVQREVRVPTPRVRQHAATRTARSTVPARHVHPRVHVSSGR
jgi:hypothetical protein